MVERDPIDLIKDQLNQWERLGEFHPDHELFKQWQVETRTILEKAFSPKSTHCQNFMALRFREVSIKGFDSPEVSRMNAARYKKDLENAKNILMSAIKELTLDRTLFKKIQTTPKTVEVAVKGEYFISTEITDPELRKAIELAFEGSGLTPVYENASGKMDSLHQRIGKIRRAKFGIFDLSSPIRAESLLELGIALGMGKEVLIIYQKGTELSEMFKEVPKLQFETLDALTNQLKKKMA